MPLHARNSTLKGMKMPRRKTKSREKTGRIDLELQIPGTQPIVIVGRSRSGKMQVFEWNRKIAARPHDMTVGDMLQMFVVRPQGRTEPVGYHP